MANRQEKTNLYKLIMARSDISAALFTCRFFIENVKTIKDRLWLPLQEAIIISYARPFSDNKPYGKLKKEWTKFEDPELKKIHDHILQARDQQIAHSDLKQNKVLVAPKGFFANSVSMGVEISTFKFPPPFFDSVEVLCQDIGRRLNSEIEIQLSTLYGDNKNKEKFVLDISQDD